MTDVAAIPSIFEAFNARALEPQQVARTFVPSHHYATLVKQAHSLVVGPRGSGKTTLLKMLQLPALEEWSHDDADMYRKRIGFTGVFVATDVTWREQMQAICNKVESEAGKLLGTAAFTTHVLRAVVSAIEYRCGRSGPGTFQSALHVSLSTELESQIVIEIATQWRLKPVIPSFMSLRHALSGRLIDLYEFGSREALLGEVGRQQRMADNPALHLDFLQACLAIIEMFDDATIKQRGRWALLFDELELAPSWILQKLIHSLRSVDDRLLFKLSMSPFSQETGELESALSAMQGHDYDIIPLWYAHKEDGYAFCKALVSSMLSARSADIDPDHFLGSSDFETPSEEWIETKTAYHPGSRLQKRFASMAQRDRSFKTYLRERNIDPSSLSVPEGDTRAADVRKIASLLIVREAFRGEEPIAAHGGRIPRLRTRKNPALYAGAKAIFAMSEGNPRWLKGIVARLLLDRLDGKAVSRAKQGQEVMNAAHRFRAMLKTIPCPPIKNVQPVRGLLSLLDQVGEHIFRAVVVDDFNPDPPGSFTVDSRTPPELFESLGRALNAGAIVYVPDGNSQLMLHSVRGKRFRLSYLLAPYYQVPLVLGKPVALTTILHGTTRASLFTMPEQEDE